MEAGEIDIRSEGNNIFIFTFGQERQRELIWDKRPWVIANSFLNLKKWDGLGEPRNIPFHSADMWIRIHNLPPRFKSLENIRLIGDLFFRYLKCDREGLERGRWRRFIRFLAEVRIDEPLQSIGELPTEAKEIIEFKFEKVTDYCLFYGLMGHNDSRCDLREMEINQGGRGELPGIYEYTIRAGCLPRILPTNEGSRSSPGTTPESQSSDDSGFSDLQLRLSP
ncbi:hypothetical protein LINGRAHAP2_LOCUS1779 [Linum grandiflorum]